MTKKLNETIIGKVLGAAKYNTEDDTINFYDADGKPLFSVPNEVLDDENEDFDQSDLEDEKIEVEGDDDDSDD